MKLTLRDVFISILMISAPAAALCAEPLAKPLSFAWPEMTCAVEQRLEQSDSGKPIESRYTLTAKRTGGNLRVSFLEFRVLDTFPEVPVRAREQYLASEYVIGRDKIERSYEVSSSGKFVRAESPADIGERNKASGKPPRLLFMDSQKTLDAKYLRDWQDFIGKWIGLMASPGTTVQMRIEHPGDEFWLTYDVPTDITVSAPIDCLRGGKALRCVTVRTHFMPAFTKAGETDENSTRHEDNSEIVLEPETMIPHSSMEEVKYRGGSLNGKLQNRYTRKFECNAGS